ncbi:MAG: transposase [Opitutaceae bacterium]
MPSAIARRLRLEFPGACYHVINRGNYRRDIFAAANAARAFETCLGEAAVRCRWRVHALVVMRNHFHLALETPDPNERRDEMAAGPFRVSRHDPIISLTP